MPILNLSFRKREWDIVSTGVRAMLLYPMNALANDQMKRLRLYWKTGKDIPWQIYWGLIDLNEKNEAIRNFQKVYQKKKFWTMNF